MNLVPTLHPLLKFQSLRVRIFSSRLLAEFIRAQIIVDLRCVIFYTTLAFSIGAF
jgi:hypothetical protein